MSVGVTFSLFFFLSFGEFGYWKQKKQKKKKTKKKSEKVTPTDMYGPTNSVKNIELWKLGDDAKRVWKIEWWVMSYELWVMSDEW